MKFVSFVQIFAQAIFGKSYFNLMDAFLSLVRLNAVQLVYPRVLAKFIE